MPKFRREKQTMSDIRTLIRSTTPFRHEIGVISDEALKTIESLSMAFTF